MRSGDAMPHDNYQRLLKLALSIQDQNNRVSMPRAACKTYNQDAMPELTETSNLLEETCDIDSPALVILGIMMSSRGNSRKLRGNGNKILSFDKDCMIPKEYHAALTPDSKDFWNSRILRIRL